MLLLTTNAAAFHARRRSLGAVDEIGLEIQPRVLPIDKPSWDSMPETDGIPIVLAVGMDQRCDTKRSIALSRSLSRKKKVPVACFGTEDNTFIFNANADMISEDSKSHTLDESIDTFMDRLQGSEVCNTPRGFHAIGISQGNLIIRGFLQRYNTPPVRAWAAIHGPLMGVGGLPECPPEDEACRGMFDFLSRTAYSSYGQSHFIQAAYLRNPYMMDDYLRTGSTLADLNNEIPDDHPQKKGNAETYRENFSSIDQLILVKAEKETTIQPPCSSWFGSFEDDSHTAVAALNSPWFTENWFGLKTLHDSNRISWLSTPGRHTSISDTDWDTYLDMME